MLRRTKAIVLKTRLMPTPAWRTESFTTLDGSLAFSSCPQPLVGSPETNARRLSDERRRA
jgi:hypothetical protein